MPQGALGGRFFAVFFLHFLSFFFHFMPFAPFLVRFGMAIVICIGVTDKISGPLREDVSTGSGGL